MDGDFASVRRVLACIRVSTREQDLEGVSIEEQTEVATNFCKRNNLPEPIKYIDVESGTQEAEADRKDFQRLLKDARHGDLVFCAKFDRFSRDLAQPIIHIRRLKRQGAIFYSHHERLDSRDPHVEITITAWAMGASIEHERIKDRTRGGKRYLRRQGCFVEGKPPFGYLRPDHDAKTKAHLHLVIDPESAPIVKRTFEWAAAGASIKIICNRLQKEYPGKLTFDRGWVHKVLRNRIYTGQV